MPAIRELQQQRHKLHKDARAIMDTAVEAGRAMDGEENETFDRMMSDADDLTGTIEREQRAREAAKLDADLDTGGGDGGGQRGAGGDRGQPRDKRTDAETEAFRAYLRGGRSSLTPDQARALVASNDPEGGFLIAPQAFSSTLIQAVDDAVPLRGLANVMPLNQSESLGVPTLDTDMDDAEWTTELGTGSDDDAMRFGKREFRTHPVAKRVKVSRKLIRSSALNVEQIVRNRLAHKFAVTQEKAFMTGDGNEKPLGLFTASSDGVPTSRDVDVSATDGVLDNNSGSGGGAADDLIDAKHTLKSAYWGNARWMFHRLVLSAVRKLKDGDGNYVWQPGLQADLPATILEVPYVLSEFAPSTVTDDAYVGMIADFSHYWIADSLQLEVQRLNELYAESNRVGFIGRMESDGAPTLAEAFVRLQINNAES